MNDDQVAAMSGIFQLCDAINNNGLSITGLTEAVELCVKDGHDNIEICLTMALRAVQDAKPHTPDSERKE